MWFDMPPASSEEARDICRQALRYCPTFPFPPALDETRVVDLPFYDDYRLVRLAAAPTEDPTAPPEAVYALYAPGDFRPLDRSGATIETMNDLAPLTLSADTALAYGLFRIAFGGAPDDHDDEWRRARIVSTLDEASLPTPDEALRASLSALIAPPRAEQKDTAADDVPSGFVVRASVLRDTSDGPTIVDRVEASLAPDGLLLDLKVTDTCQGPSPSSAPASPLIHTPLRVQTAVPVQKWYSLEADGDAALPSALTYKLGQPLSDWYNHLRNEYNVGSGANTTLLLRGTDLPFYTSFCLLEVLELSADSCRRSYALARRQDDHLHLRPLNGTSPVLHETNAEAGELRLDVRTAYDYLRFFCWAVHGEEGGPFYVPRSSHEIPLALPEEVQRSTLREKRQRLNGLDFSIRPVGEEEAERLDYPPGEPSLFRCKAPVAYASAVFESWFAIRPTGMVEMVHDEPRVADLPVDYEEYGVDKPLFVLRPLAISRTDRKTRPASPHYLQNGTATPPPSDDAEQAWRAETFLSALRNHGVVEKGLLHEPLVVGSTALECTHLCPELQIRNCRFRATVSLRDLSGGPALTFVDCAFEKGLCARAAQSTGSWTFIGCTFGSLDEEGSTDIALDLENASLTGDLTLFDCTVGGRVFAPGFGGAGNVRLHGCRVAPSLDDVGQRLRFDELGVGLDADEDGLMTRYLSEIGWGQARFQYQAPAISLEGAQIKGDLEITSAPTVERRVVNSENATWDAGHEQAGATVASVVLGPISGREIDVGGSIVLFGMLCMGSLIFSTARCHGNVILFWSEADAVPGPHLRALGNVALFSAQIDGFLSARNAEVEGTFSLYGARIGGNVVLLGLSTLGLKMEFSTVGGYVVAFRQQDTQARGRRSSLRVRGDLLLSGADINILELRGAQIDGAVRIRTGRFGSLTLTLGVEPADEDGKYWPAPCRVGAVQMNAITVEESLDVSGLEVRPIEKNLRKDIGQNRGTFELTHSHIGVNLTVFVSDPRRSLTRRWSDSDPSFLDGRWQRPGEQSAPDDASDQPPIPTDFRSSIGRDLDLQANEIGGHLDLRNVAVAGDLRLNDTTVGLDLRMGADVTGATEIPIHTLETRCTHLDAEKLGCGGDIDGTGLRLRGDFRARGAQVKGELLFLKSSEEAPNDAEEQPDRSSKTPPFAQPAPTSPQLGHAWIEGELDLEAITANHLALTGPNVPSPTAKVRLARAQLGRLEIVDPTPGPIDLSHVTVLRWVFGDDEHGADGDPGADRYIGVLNKMDPFDRSTWIGVEQSLRDQTKERDANEVYRAMGWKAREESFSKRRWLRMLSLRRDAPPDPTNTADPRRDWWRRWWPGPFLALGSLAALVLILWGTTPSALELALLQWGAVLLTIGLLLVDREGLYGVAVGFGTKAWRPMMVALIALPITFGVFSQPENVRATSDLLEVLDEDRARLTSTSSPPTPASSWAPAATTRRPSASGSASPAVVSFPTALEPPQPHTDSTGNVRPQQHADSRLEISPSMLNRLPEYSDVHWGTADALALTLRYQVPIIPFFTHDRWEASSRELSLPPRWVADWMGTAERIGLGISAEEFAFVLTLWHWLAWPLFLIGAAAWAYRGRRH